MASTADRESTRFHGADGGIRVVGLSHWFDSEDASQPVHALDDIDLAIRPGEFLTLVGPSGCGKSTLLRCIAGLTRQSQGHVYFNGDEVRGPSKDRGVVFQDAALLPWRTVWRNISYGLELNRVPRRERHEIVSRLIELVGLSGFENRYVHELSGGMKQRVGVARTWALDPAVVLMDEPFAAVDAQTRLTLQEEMVRMTTDECGRATLFITHSVEEAVFLGTKVAVMSRRPGVIKEIVDVPVPRAQRSAEYFEREPAVHEIREHVLHSVREEVQERAPSTARSNAPVNQPLAARSDAHMEGDPTL